MFRPASSRPADFDGDGDNDLAVIATDPILLVQAVLVFENIGQIVGDLAFAAPITFTVGVTATPNHLCRTPVPDCPATSSMS